MGEPGGKLSARLRIGRDAALAALAALAFVAFSAWWVLYDRSLAGGGDPGTHLGVASTAADMLERGDLGGIAELGPIGDAFFYPPLVHLVGAIPGALGLAIEDWGTIAINLVFVPLLALGVFLVGKRVYGARAGLLAVVFALGTPMILSLFHVFVLDAPLAAAIALTVAALVHSERFALRRETALAGVLVGISLLIKPAAPLYLLGPLLVMLAGGGWRQWRNLLIAAGAAVLVAGPYYALHLNEFVDLGQETTVGSEIGATGEAFDRDARISIDNLTWYGWGAVNQVFYLPLLALFAVGAVSAIRDFRRPHVLELLAGVGATYLALAIVLSIRDVRYLLPLVVYVAVLATGWIATSSRPLWRRAGAGVLGIAVAANVAASAVSVPDLKYVLPSSAYELGNDPGTITFLDDRGYFVGPPQPEDLWHRLLGAAEREDVESAHLRVRTVGLWGPDPVVFDATAQEYGIREFSLTAGPSARPDLVIDTWFEGSEFPGQERLRPACGVIEDGVGFNGEPLRMVVAARLRERAGPLRPWCDF